VGKLGQHSQKRLHSSSYPIKSNLGALGGLLSLNGGLPMTVVAVAEA
jgi:hypothetical protein